jgi:transposase
MANQLKMASIQAILLLHKRGWSFRRIARELGVHRETVARYVVLAEERALRLEAPDGAASTAVTSRPTAAPIGCEVEPRTSKPTEAPIGSDGRDDDPRAPKPAKAPIGSERVWETLLDSPRVSSPRLRGACSHLHEAILAKLDQGLTAQRIYQDLTAEHGFEGSYYSVCRFVRKLRRVPGPPFRRMESPPGEEAQVDFGSAAPVVGPEGRRRRPHVFRIVLSHSRKAYSEVVPRQTTEAFLGCLENAFRHFGGTPRVLVIDNLRAAVSKADWYEPELNPKIRSFCDHYGVVIRPTKPYTPRHKGKVERGIGYVKDNALKGRTFASLAEQNVFLHEWEANVADTRIHGTIRRQVGKLFEEVERGALQPLPPAPFACFHEAERVVHRDGHVEIARAYYSVPPEHLGRRVWVRWDARLVRIYTHRMEPIAVHVRHEPGRFSTQTPHLAAEKISGVERGVAWLLGRTRRIGPQAGRWAESVVRARGIESARVLMGLLSLAERYTVDAVERSCGAALTYGDLRLRTLRALIRRAPHPQEQLLLLTEHPIIRSLSDYGDLVRASFRKEHPR